jgi:hypothetical protein
LLLVSYHSKAEPNKEIYELQAMCSKHAREFFDRLGLVDASFENHYNPDINGCFLLVNITKGPATGKERGFVQWELWNMNENRQINFFAFYLKRDDFSAFYPEGEFIRPLHNIVA